MNTVLAAIDFSPVSREVVAEATDISRALHARLVLVTAVNPPVVATDVAPLVPDVLDFTAELERAAKYQLQQMQRRLAERGVTVETIHDRGWPANVILAQAKEVKAAYIVLGSHGHTAFYDLLVGSTTSAVLKRAPCPVVVIPCARSRGMKKRKSSKRR
jgi:nucleotide-binding universal stress UspA family protein